MGSTNMVTTRKDKTMEWSQGNRDLLVELKTQMIGVGESLVGLRAEVKEIKDGMKADIEFLKNDKISRAEAVRIQTEAQTVNIDHEARLRFLERYLWWGFGALGVITFALNYFHPFG